MIQEDDEVLLGSGELVPFAEFVRRFNVAWYGSIAFFTGLLLCWWM